MNHKRITSIVLATLMLVSLFAVVSSQASVSDKASGTAAPLVGQTLAGTGPAASTEFNSAGQTDIFAVDANAALWSTATFSGSSWNYIGGVCTSSPAAVASLGNTLHIDAFVRGTDGRVWHTSYQNGWSGWDSLGGQVAAGTGPAVASWSAGRLDVFVQGTDNQLWHKWWNGASWSGWESLGGTLTASPGAVASWTSVTDSIAVVVRGTDGAVWQKSYSNGWSGWEYVGGQLAPNTGPAVSQDLWIIAQGTNNQFWQKNGNSAWQPLAVTPETPSATSPGAVCTVTNEHTLVCFTSTNGNVWYGVHDSGGHITSWTPLGSP
jgi:hypothetical protein